MSFAALLLSSCATAPDVPPVARSELAPTGKLRVGINVQNFLLVNKERTGGEYGGIAVDLGREFGRRLGVPVELVAFDTAGKLADAVKSGAWDVAFLGNEPARANEIAFSAAYLEIEAGYLVPAGSPIRTIEDVDREGVRVAVNAKSAYDLYLTRNLQRAKLFRAPTVDASYELFVSDKLDALAGLKPRLVMDAEKLPGSRVLEGRFSAVKQSIGTPQGRPSGAKYLREFTEDAKASGFVAKAIERHAVRGVSVAPPEPTSSSGLDSTRGRSAY
ncbi:MAG: ABC transporter substrate-binding protein [Betaproteobacteria bacterium]|nr:MAG: ABC transporter substrate-binding protein [Betaproteobacteria bacterium]